MKRIVLVLFFVMKHLTKPQEVDFLSQLPLSELLSHKKIIEGKNFNEEVRQMALPLVASSEEGVGFPKRKTFYEDDYDDDKSHVHKKKSEHKMHDILNTSITALSYLAFGGYLLCMIANAMREKRRRITMAFPPPGPTMSNQFAHVFQQYVTHRPVRPYIRFPTVTVHQGGKKRRRRSS